MSTQPKFTPIQKRTAPPAAAPANQAELQKQAEMQKQASNDYYSYRDQGFVSHLALLGVPEPVIKKSFECYKKQAQVRDNKIQRLREVILKHAHTIAAAA